MEMNVVILLMLSIIMIIIHYQMLIFMLIVLELLNVIFLVYIAEFMNLEIVLMSLFVQVLDSLLLMVLSIMGIFSWENSYNWSLI